MLRWPSGVTAIMEEAVDEPAVARAVVKSHAQRRHGFRRTRSPSRSSHTLPRNSRAAAQRGQARHGVGGAAARHFCSAGCWSASALCSSWARNSSIRVMRALGDAVVQQEVVVHRGDHVHDGIAQAGDIVFLRHVLSERRYNQSHYGTDAMFASMGRAARLIFDPAFAGIAVKALLLTLAAVRGWPGAQRNMPCRSCRCWAIRR